MASLVEGCRLGRFVLGPRLATGGMAEVWAATTEDRNEAVALKVMLPQFVQDPHFRGMFMDEVRISMRLQHPNIVRVFGVHHEQGQLFLSMERLDGLDLRRLLARLVRIKERIPIGIALKVAREACAALAYAHERKSASGHPMAIVHRDVSPHNIMLTDAGSVKVLDFGIARAAERLVRTRTGVVKGKIAYMAPEQALGVGVTPQTDIFAAGVVLWEMLAMRRLFVGENDPAVVDLVVRAVVPPIVEFNPEVPVAIQRLLDRMLQQRAAHRPADMREVEGVLRAALERREARPDAAAWLSPHLREPLHMPTTPDQTEPTAVFVKEAPATTVDEAAPSSDVTLEQPRIDPDRPPAPGRDADADSATDPVRLPTRSEIVRAVENQATLEVPSPNSKDQPPVEPPIMSDEPSERAPQVVIETLPPGQDPSPTASLSADLRPRPTEDIPAEDPSVEVSKGAAPARKISRLPMTTADWARHTLPGRPVQSEPSGRLLPTITVVLAGLVVLLAALLVLKSG
ncbi:MAG: protein kinase [Myxococcota bacterium]